MGNKSQKNLRCTQHREIAGRGVFDLSSGEMASAGKGGSKRPFDL